jgi:hypothetical protein
MSTDVDLEKWRRQWQGGAAGASRGHEVERLRRRALRETSWIKLGMIAPVLVTVLIGGGVVLRALRSGETVDVVLAVESWIFIVALWVGSLAIARGTWRPLADTTTAFVDVSIRRREANLRGATFGAWAYVLQFLIQTVVMSIATSAEAVAVLTSWPVIVLGWVGVPSFLVGVYWFRRRQRAELERLLELKRQLQGD